MLKNPLKRHSRYMTFDAIAGDVNHSTVSTREIYAFPTTLSILRQYEQKALCIKTPLSRGETGRLLPTRKIKKTRCFCEAYTGLPVVRATENQKALNCVVLKYSIPVSEEQQIKEKRETLASGLTC